MWREITIAGMTMWQCLMVARLMMPGELGNTAETAHQRK